MTTLMSNMVNGYLRSRVEHSPTSSSDNSVTMLDHENLETFILKREKMPDCGFIRWCAESKGLSLATFAR